MSDWAVYPVKSLKCTLYCGQACCALDSIQATDTMHYLLYSPQQLFTLCCAALPLSVRNTTTVQYVCLSVCLLPKVRHPSAIGLAEGDCVQVKYFGKDPVTGRARVSRKSLLPLPEQASFVHRSHPALVDEREEKGQWSSYPRPRHSPQERASGQPAFERPIARYSRYKRPAERQWSQREGGQRRLHQQGSGYNPRWRSKY